MDIRFVEPQPGYCVIGKRTDEYYYIYTRDKNYLLHMKNGKYGEYVTRKKEYDTIEEFLSEHKLVCLPVETTEVEVQSQHGHPDINFFVSVRDPDSDKWILARIIDEDEPETITLYRAHPDTSSAITCNWVPGHPHLVFSTEYKMNEFLESLDTLYMLNR